MKESEERYKKYVMWIPLFLCLLIFEGRGDSVEINKVMFFWVFMFFLCILLEKGNSFFVWVLGIFSLIYQPVYILPFNNFTWKFVDCVFLFLYFASLFLDWRKRQKKKRK